MIEDEGFGPCDAGEGRGKNKHAQSRLDIRERSPLTPHRPSLSLLPQKKAEADKAIVL